MAIQIAGGQLTPRIIATILLRNNVVRYSVGLFVFTLVFAVGALNRQDRARCTSWSRWSPRVLGVACIADFLFLIDYAARLLRPVAVVAQRRRRGHGNDRVRLSGPGDRATAGGSRCSHECARMPTRMVAHRETSQIVLAVDIPTLIALARRFTTA